MALSETMMKVLFKKQMVEFMGAEVKLPMTIYADNIGVIYLAIASGTSQRTKYVDVRLHFV